MAYRKGDRYQQTMFPATFEEMVPEDDPARVYDAFVEQLDFEKLDFKMTPNKVGNPEYDPKSMLKVILYGYSYGERSSRKLERNLHHNIIFMWLTGGLKPDHITIARFRKRNKTLLKKIFYQCAQLCIKLELIKGNTLFVDGSKIRANAGMKNTYSLNGAQKKKAKIQKRINAILRECDRMDKQEEGEESLVKLREELGTLEKIHSKVSDAIEEMSREERKELNTTDPDSKLMKGRQGSHASYNSQVIVDDEHGLIVHSDVVNDGTDNAQFADQINQANDVLETPCQTACGDGGYFNVENTKLITDQGINVILPSHRQMALESKRKKDTGFEKDYFKYDEQKNSYICPKGHPLTFRFYSKVNQAYIYRIKKKTLCLTCPHFGQCTSAKRGRSIFRMKEEKLRASLERTYDSPVGQMIYKRRKEKVELVFGHIKHNLRGNGFSSRGLPAVKSEMALFSTVFNIRRLISLMGPKKLIAAIAALSKHPFFTQFSLFHSPLSLPSFT